MQFNTGFGVKLNNQGDITGLVLSGIVFGPTRRYLYRSGNNTLQNKTPRPVDLNEENPDEYGLSVSQDPTIFKKAITIDQAELDKLYVVADPTEDDPLHAMLRTATREEFAEWVATRPNLPVGSNDIEEAASVVSEYTTEIWNAALAPGATIDEGGGAVPGGE